MLMNAKCLASSSAGRAAAPHSPRSLLYWDGSNAGGEGMSEEEESVAGGGTSGGVEGMLTVGQALAAEARIGWKFICSAAAGSKRGGAEHGVVGGVG